MTTLTRIDPAQTRKIEEPARDHGLVDRLGRKVGCKVYLDEVVFVQAPEGATYGFKKPAGTYFRVVTQPTRDGQPYQASQDPKYFECISDADAFIEAYFAKNAKANAKKFAPATEGAVAPVELPIQREVHSTRKVTVDQVFTGRFL